MILSQLRYRFYVLIIAISRFCGPKAAGAIFNPLKSLARRRFIRRKYDFMLTNARVALPGRDDQEYDSIVTGSIDHIWCFLLRNLCGKGRCSESRDVVNEAVIDSVVTGEEKGAVVVTSHQGDWENLIQYFRSRKDVRPCNLYKKPKCPVIDRVLCEMRGISQYCSGYGIMKQFKKAEDSKVFALIGVDQKPTNKGVEVDFLNRPTVISPVCVQIAMKAKVPLIVAKTLIINDRTEISFRKVDLPDYSKMEPQEAISKCLQAVMNEISNDILDNPEQWVMWSHNFWKKAA